MKLHSKLLTSLTAVVVGAATFAIAFGGSASADCIYQYNPTSFQTSVTPSFNLICGAPQVNDESNFVRIRPDVANNDEDDTNNPTYTSGTLDSACTSGDKFDVWNYVHNDASPNENPDVGNGDAVAVGSYINMQAPQSGTTANSFNFSGTVGDSGNLTGTAGPTSTTNIDPAVLNCDGQQVKLSIVPGSINEYSQPYNGWETLGNQTEGNINSFFNSNLPIGSTNTGGMSSGTQWACWTYRIVIVYQVEVTPVTPPPTPPTCNLLDLENDNGVARIDNIEYTGNGNDVTGFSLVIKNGNTSVTKPIALNGFPFTYPMTAGQTYTFTANVLYGTNGSVTGPKCVGTLTTTTPPPSTPPSTPTPAAPTQLVNTGPGSVVAIFTGATVAGTAFYNWFLKKRLVKH